MTTNSAPILSDKSKKELLEKAARIRPRNPGLAEGIEDVAHGRTLPAEEVYRRLGI